MILLTGGQGDGACRYAHDYSHFGSGGAHGQDRQQTRTSSRGEDTTGLEAAGQRSSPVLSHAANSSLCLGLRNQTSDRATHEYVDKDHPLVN